MNERYDDLLAVYVPTALVVVALVYAAYALVLVRFRAREGRSEPLRQGEAREGVNVPASRDRLGWEIGYAVALAVVAGALVAISLPALADDDALVDEPGLVVDVTAFQWGWAFAYPESGVDVVENAPRRPELVVPTGTTVRLRVSARDVTHSFWIPEARVKRDAFPDHVNEVDVVFEEPGTFVGECAEFCGLEHSGMDFLVRAVPPDRFDAWLAAAAGGRPGS